MHEQMEMAGTRFQETYRCAIWQELERRSREGLFTLEFCNEMVDLIGNDPPIHPIDGKETATPVFHRIHNEQPLSPVTGMPHFVMVCKGTHLNTESDMLSTAIATLDQAEQANADDIIEGAATHLSERDATSSSESSNGNGEEASRLPMTPVMSLTKRSSRALKSKPSTAKRVKKEPVSEAKANSERQLAFAEDLKREVQQAQENNLTQLKAEIQLRREEFRLREEAKELQRDRDRAEAREERRMREEEEEKRRADDREREERRRELDREDEKERRKE